MTATAATAQRSMALDYASHQSLSQPLRRLLGLWQQQCGADGAPPPRLALGPHRMKPFLPDLFIVEYVRAAARYRYRLIGTAIATMYRCDSTGKFCDEVYDRDTAAEFHQIYDWVRLTGQPSCLRSSLFFLQRDAMLMETLLLPLGPPPDRDPADYDPQILGAARFRLA
jgi:hypothetical protein